MTPRARARAPAPPTPRRPPRAHCHSVVKVQLCTRGSKECVQKNMNSSKGRLNWVGHSLHSLISQNHSLCQSWTFEWIRHSHSCSPRLAHSQFSVFMTDTRSDSEGKHSQCKRVTNPVESTLACNEERPESSTIDVLQYHAEFQYWMYFHIVTIRHCPLVNTPVLNSHLHYCVLVRAYGRIGYMYCRRSRERVLFSPGLICARSVSLNSPVDRLEDCDSVCAHSIS